jgi:hypothetical protein
MSLAVFQQQREPSLTYSIEMEKSGVPECLTHSEVLGQLRRELSHSSDFHIFIILGASVSTLVVTLFVLFLSCLA